jgi:hypothetical protein
MHLAELNIGRSVAALDDAVMAGFVARLAEINALADASPGFVWRVQGHAGNATDLRPYDDERILINLSVWESVASFRQYVYRSAHAQVLRDRHRWFEPVAEPSLVMWWIPVGHLPSITEAQARMKHLRAHGSTAYAFSFERVFPPE